MLICAEQTPHPRPSQALHLLRDMHSRGKGELKIPILPVLLVFPVFPVFLAGVTGVTGETGEFENRLFSGRGEALRRRVADKVGVLSNLFEGGLLIWLLICLQRQPPLTAKATLKVFGGTFLQKGAKRERR